MQKCSSGQSGNPPLSGLFHFRCQRWCLLSYRNNSSRCKGISAVLCTERDVAWFTYLEATSKLQSQQNSAGQLLGHTWTPILAVEVNPHCQQAFRLSSGLRTRNLSPTEVTISCSPAKEPYIFIPPNKATRLWFSTSLRTHKALSSLGYGWR